jgi:hypothetical protein
MRITLFCTGRGSHEDNPQTVYVYDGEIPVPGTWGESSRSTVFEFVCRRSHPADRRVPLGGCGYSPRPSDEALRKLINAAAAMPGQRLDVSYSGL